MIRSLSLLNNKKFVYLQKEMVRREKFKVIKEIKLTNKVNLIGWCNNVEKLYKNSTFLFMLLIKKVFQTQLLKL